MLSTTVTHSDIRSAITTLSLSNRPLCVHSSLRSLGWVEGGAPMVVDGLLAEGCTVLLPSFTSGFEVAPPAQRQYPRNGCSYETETWPGEAGGEWYSPDSTQVDADMGAIPAFVVSSPDRVRGDHPSDSFTAIGPLAHELVDGQQPMHVYAPLEQLADRGGWVLLMGVNLTRMTLIHLAEQRAGRTLFRRWARDSSGNVYEATVGGCSEGFEQLQPVLAPIMRSTRVGESVWRAYPASAVLEIASAAVRLNPGITHCPDPDCLRCNDAILGGPIVGS